jgi:hypothetical protein
VNPPDPYSTANFVFVVGTTAVIAVGGALAALRHPAARWRTALLVGLALPVLATCLWWWGWSLSLAESLESGRLEFTRVPSDAFDQYVRDAWIHFAVELIGLGAFAALVWAALHGRPSPSHEGTRAVPE